MDEPHYLVIALQGSRHAVASLELGDLTQDPYQLVKAWSQLPRGIRLALKAVGLDALGLSRMVLTLCRNGAAGPIRPGPRLEISLMQQEPTSGPAPRVVIVRHPEWAGLETVEERFLHSR